MKRSSKAAKYAASKPLQCNIIVWKKGKMREEDLISIIVPVYNIREYLPRCVESIRAQTYSKLEIILVDDGSEDGSGELCDDYAGKDVRIQVIHKKNGGLSDARNAGLAIVRGKYIGYVDGDDFIQPDMYGAMLNAMAGQNAQIAVCRYRQVGEVAINQETTGEVRGFSREEALEIYICGHERYRIYPSVWSKLFLKDTVKEIRFAAGISSEDIMYTTQAFCGMDRCAYLDVAYYNYIVDRKNSIMNKKIGERRFAFEIPVWREQAEYLKNQGMKELSEKAKYYFYRKMLFYYIDFQEAKEKEFAHRLSKMLRGEKAEIKAVYQNGWATLGDRVRMKVILIWPGLYYQTVRLYDKYVIPLRQRKSAE